MTDNGHRALDRFARRYTGNVYVGVAASEFAVGRARDTVWNLDLRNGDSLPQMAEFTKGYQAREWHVRRFLEATDYEFILHLDGDMLYPADMLERLRSHQLPCVSGLYFRRTYNPMIPIWFEDDPTYQWPMMPFRQVPERGRLYRLGATGAGCWLIHRSVYEAVEPMLHGEQFWLEDDMDVWPYDIDRVLSGRETLRVLRGHRDDIVGGDIRLAFFIRQAGFTIWGDPAANCGHFLPYPLTLEDWQAQGPEFHRDFAQETTQQLLDIRSRYPTNDASVAKVVEEVAAR